VHATLVHAEPLDDLPPRVLRHRDDRVGAPRVRGRQRRVVAANLRGGGLGVGEEEEIVHGDHAGGAGGWNEQRMGGMDNVGVAGQPFDRRPLRAVPQIVQHRHRDTAIDDAGPERGARAWCGTIGPRAREHRHLVGRVRGRVRAHELVHIFTDPGAGTQRGAVVHQDPHLSRYDSVC
jgi:hypothetical protein